MFDPLAALVLAFVVAVSPTSDDDSSRDGIVLQWSAPPQCPGEDEVRAHLRRYLGGEHEPRTLRAHGTIRRQGDGWSLALDVDGQRRELRSQRCDALAEAAAVVLSLAMDADAPGPATEDEPVSDAEAVTREGPATQEEPATNGRQVAAREPTRPSVLAPLPGARPVRAPSGRLGLRLDGGIFYGSIPLSPDVALSVAWLATRLRVELRGLFVAPGREPVVSGSRLRIFQGSVGPRACHRVFAGRIEWPLCAGGHLGVQRVEVRPAARNPAQYVMFGGVDVGTGLVWRVRDDVALWVGGDALVAIGRGRAALRGSGTWRPGPAALRVSIGVEVRLSRRRRR